MAGLGLLFESLKANLSLQYVGFTVFREQDDRYKWDKLIEFCLASSKNHFPMQNLLKTEKQNVRGVAQQTSNKNYLIIARKNCVFYSSRATDSNM